MTTGIKNISGSVNPQALNQRRTAVPGTEGFAGILQQAVRQERLKFSAHALDRLRAKTDGINTSTQKKLEEAVSKAAAKGAKEALIWLEDTAYVVSIRNRTVITAVPREAMKDNVFTNIDCAVIAE